MWFYDLSSLALALLLFGVVLGVTVAGAVVGRRMRHRADDLREPFSVLQGALLGIVALVLAFGLSLAIDRYESRRTAVVEDANAIGTTYLRAQTLREPVRSRSLRGLLAYTDTAIRLTDSVPGSAEELDAVGDGQALQRRLWALAGRALDENPLAAPPRLYVESLNEMIDEQTVRVAGLSNRVPNAVLAVEVIGAALALGLLAAYLAVAGRGLLPVMIAAGLVSSLLFVTADLDRPHRGLIEVPDTTLVNQLESMELPPAAAGPERQAPGGT